MHDDRLAMIVEDMETDMRGELTWLSNIDSRAWDLFGCVAGSGLSGQVLRTRCLEAASVASAYASRKAFAAAREMPWCLAKGCISSNLSRLAAQSEPPSDAVAAKIWSLLLIGYNRTDLERAISLLGHIRWSTKVTEQAHGSAAAVHKAHRMYSNNVLARRALLHQL